MRNQPTLAPESSPPREEKNLARRRFDRILKRATDKQASDVHLKSGLPPIVRVNGHLYYLKEDGSPDSSEKKNKHGRLRSSDLTEIAYVLMNSTQVKRYEEGQEIDLGYEMAGIGRFRINICQQRSKPRIVCRHIPEIIHTPKQLGLPDVIEQLCTNQRGLILVTGATGSGKSTTLAAMIDQITRQRSCHIVTIEDPIEFIFKDRKSIVTQREVGPDTQNFTQALKYALRQDPDVILVGEMRDEETILMALAAAETGHLVFSTLHTVNATETINRIVGAISGPMQDQARHQLSSVLVGVVSQRLLKRKDGQGRIPAVEILVNNRRVEEIIADPKRTKSLRDVIEESASLGMQSFDQSLMKLYQNNFITEEEALEHCSNVRDFKLRLQGIGSGQWGNGDEPSVTLAEGMNHNRPSGKDIEALKVELEDHSTENPKITTLAKKFQKKIKK